jgi:hypothetical protein
MGLDRLEIDDESSFRHVAIYGALRERMTRDAVTFAVAKSASEDDVALLNLAFYRPGDVAEILVEERLTADQLAHNAWHHVCHAHLGDGARSAAGLLLAEAVASAFDAYLVGRLLGHAPGSLFLQTQVPAMADAAYAAGVDESSFEALLERMSQEPEACFESLRALLFDVARGLVACTGADEAAAVLSAHASHLMAPLLHHYELVGWVLFTRAYADPRAPEIRALEIDAALRSSEDAIAWLERHVLDAPR